MKDNDIIGYISDFRITKGKAIVTKSKFSVVLLRFKILWAAIKNIFTGRGIWLSGQISASIGTPGMCLETWIKRDCNQEDWEHWCVTFDGKKATGYINGVDITIQQFQD
jgi:hypothetical protein